VTDPQHATRDRLREQLGHPRTRWLVLLVALVLGLPTLDVGLLGDDLAQAELLATPGRSWDMFVFVSGPRAHTEQLRAIGQFPWWVDPDLHVAFFRPLAVLTHALDVRLWPSAAWLMHLHSVLWYALACLLAWVLARRLCSNTCAAGVAGLVYAGAFGHLVPVGWLAHRNGLISTVFALVMLLAHDRWRRDGDKLGAVLAVAALAGALLAGESGVVSLAFVFAYAVILDQAPLRARALSLVPSLLLVVAWRVVYDALGYGVSGSGAYVDPVAGVAELITLFPSRYFALLTFSVSPPFSTSAPALLWWGVTLVLLASAGVFAATTERPAARFGVLAAALGCVPLTASVPFERLLVLTSFGVALLWGELIDAWLLTGPRPRGARAIAGLVVLVHVLVSPLMFLARALSFDQMQPSAAAYAEDAWPGAPAMQGKIVLIVHTPNYMAVDSLPRVLRALGTAQPARIWVLHAGVAAPEIDQIDTHTLELRAPHGWPSDDVTGFWRHPGTAPFAVGDRIPTADFTAVVDEVADGRATRVRFVFARPLDDPGQAWLLWLDGQHRKINPVAW
jgi:hypothetical protein